MQSPEALAGDAMNRARVIILNDVPVGDAVAAKLVTFVEGGGGLLMARGPARVVAAAPRGMAAGVDWAARRSHARHAGEAERNGLRPRGVRAVPRAAQRRFLDHAFLFVSRPDGGERRHRAGALRHRRAGARRAQRRTRPGRGVCVDARSHLERSRAQADVPAVRASAWPPSVGIQGAAGVADHRPGARRRRGRSGRGRHVGRAGARRGGPGGPDPVRTAPRPCRCRSRRPGATAPPAAALELDRAGFLRNSRRRDEMRDR